MSLTTERLRRLGVEQAPEVVEALLLRAIARSVDPRPPPEPHRELTSAEVAVLESGGAEFTPLLADQVDPQLATAVEFAALVATGLTVEESAAVLGVHQTRVRQRLTARTLYGLRDGNVWRLPRFQFAGGRVLPGAERVFPALPASAHPVEVARWFTAPDPDLVVGADETPISPRDWLAGGRDPADVARLAREL
jgi:hypothetical protein